MFYIAIRVFIWTVILSEYKCFIVHCAFIGFTATEKTIVPPKPRSLVRLPKNIEGEAQVGHPFKVPLLTEVLQNFPQSLQENAEIEPESKSVFLIFFFAVPPINNRGTSGS